MDNTKRVLELVDEIAATVRAGIDEAIEEAKSVDPNVIISGVVMAFVGEIAVVRAQMEILLAMYQQGGNVQ